MGIIFIIVLIAVVWIILSQTQGYGREFFHNGPRTQVETPLEILKKRYARGEIDRTEFEQRKAGLQ